MAAERMEKSATVRTKMETRRAPERNPAKKAIPKSRPTMATTIMNMVFMISSSRTSWFWMMLMQMKITPERWRKKSKCPNLVN